MCSYGKVHLCFRLVQAQLLSMNQVKNEHLLLTIPSGHLMDSVQTPRVITIQIVQSRNLDLEFHMRIRNWCMKFQGRRCWIMRGRGITAACLRMARRVVGRVIRWLDMRRIGVLCPWRLRRFSEGWRSEKGRGRNLRFRFRWLRFIMREFRICLWNQNSDRRKA